MEDVTYNKYIGRATICRRPCHFKMYLASSALFFSFGILCKCR